MKTNFSRALVRESYRIKRRTRKGGDLSDLTHDLNGVINKKSKFPHGYDVSVRELNNLIPREIMKREGGVRNVGWC